MISKYILDETGNKSSGEFRWTFNFPYAAALVGRLVLRLIGHVTSKLQYFITYANPRASIVTS
jgi:hypothetical protein